MKKNILIGFSVILLGLTGSSCKKCSNCTYNDPDRGKITEEVCSTGQSYKTALKVYEDNGWSCE